MGVLEEIAGKFEQNLDLIRKCFQEALTGLEAGENHLNGLQESLSESSKELAVMLEAIEARAKEVEDKERVCRLFLEQGWKELEVKKNELSVIRDDIRVREEKLSELEKLIGGLFERIDLEGKHIGEIRSSIDEGFREICFKERRVADRWRELESVKKQIESREIELGKKEEKLEGLQKEIVVKEKVLGSKQGMLEARESELEAREKVLELQKVLELKQRELDSAQKSKEGCSKKPDSINPIPSWGRAKKRRKCGDNGAYENDSEQHAAINLVGSDSDDSGHSGTGCDLNLNLNQVAGQAAGAPHGGAEKVEMINDSGSDDDSCPEFFQLPNPDFNDFDKVREESCFAANQFWACYDDVDGMPRFCAKIKKVHSPGFKILINWLEPDPDDPDQIDWAEQFPVGCGKFKLSNPEVILSRLTFSHQVHCDKHMDKCSFMIYPRKDETWALFKDWDIKWITDPSNHKKYKYEIVQIVSDFVEGAGIRVAFLEKVRGFVSLFQQRSRNPAQSVFIPSSDLFRFSHRVPSFNMCGTEKEGVPEGCFELDPACLPANPDDICYPLGVEVDDKNFSAECNCSCSEASQKNELKLSESEIKPKKFVDRKSGFVGETCIVRWSPRGLKIAETQKISSTANNVFVQTETAKHMNGKGSKSHSEFYLLKTDVSVSKSDKQLDVQMQELSPCKSNSIHQSLSPSGKVSEDFHDFKEERSEKKFSLGQIWALYTPEHKLPKMYGQIKKIGRSPFTLYIAPLESSLVPKNATQPACGTFVVKSVKLQPLQTCSFSHLLKADFIGKNRVEIFPRVGEVWVLFGKWDAESSLSELQNCECHVVEIIDCTDGHTKVSPLVPLKPYRKSLFRTPRGQRSGIETMDIEKNELARFSHQIPAFQLTSKHGNSLAGCWQLDRASVPRKLVLGK